MVDPLNETSQVECPVCGESITSPMPDGHSTRIGRQTECGHVVVFIIDTDTREVENVRPADSEDSDSDSVSTYTHQRDSEVVDNGHRSDTDI